MAQPTGRCASGPVRPRRNPSRGGRASPLEHRHVDRPHLRAWCAAARAMTSLRTSGRSSAGMRSCGTKTSRLPTAIVLMPAQRKRQGIALSAIFRPVGPHDARAWRSMADRLTPSLQWSHPMYGVTCPTRLPFRRSAKHTRGRCARAIAGLNTCFPKNRT